MLKFIWSFVLIRRNCLERFCGATLYESHHFLGTRSLLIYLFDSLWWLYIIFLFSVSASICAISIATIEARVFFFIDTDCALRTMFVKTFFSLTTGLSCLRVLFFLLCITIICRLSRLDMSKNIISNHAVTLTSTSKSDCWRSWPLFGLGLTGVCRFFWRHFLIDIWCLNNRCEGNLIFIYSLWVARYCLIIFFAEGTFCFIIELLWSRRAWQIESCWLHICLDIDRTDCLVSYYINKSILFYDIELINSFGVLDVNLDFFDLMLLWHFASTVVTTVIWSFVTLVQNRWVSSGCLFSWGDRYRLGDWS